MTRCSTRATVVCPRTGRYRPRKYKLPAWLGPRGERQLVRMGWQALGDPEDLVRHPHGLPAVRAKASKGGALEEEVGIPEAAVHQSVEVDGADLVGADGKGRAGGLADVIVMDRIVQLEAAIEEEPLAIGELVDLGAARLAVRSWPVAAWADSELKHRAAVGYWAGQKPPSASVRVSCRSSRASWRMAKKTGSGRWAKRSMGLALVEKGLVAASRTDRGG